MQRVRSARELLTDFADALEARLEAGYDGTNEGILDWLERECGAIIRDVPAVRQIVECAIDHFRDRRPLRLAVLGPRGGGKTYAAALIELVAVRWFGGSWANLGGSKTQALRCYKHLRNAVSRSDDLHDYVSRLLTSILEVRTGAEIEVLACSHTSVRGPHPRGPSGLGGLTLDEVAEIEDELIDAAGPILTSADPSALLYLSTMGTEMRGRWWEIVRAKGARPGKRPMDFYSFDIFDVAKRCTYDCETTCPRPAFAEAQYDAQGHLLHEAYCAGKAHEVDGWVPVDEIAEYYDDLPRVSFEREYMGINNLVKGRVYRADLIEAASVESVRIPAERLQPLRKVVGIDWGFAGQTAVVYAVRFKRMIDDELVTVLAVYRWEMYTEVLYEDIRARIMEHIEREKIQDICADSENPNENEALAQAAMKVSQKSAGEYAAIVRPVAFGKWKRYGLGEVTRRLEKGLILFPRTFNDVPVPGREKALEYLREYRMDDNGNPIKEDDHIPDALLCACLRWSKKFVPEPMVF